MSHLPPLGSPRTRTAHQLARSGMRLFLDADLHAHLPVQDCRCNSSHLRPRLASATPAHSPTTLWSAICQHHCLVFLTAILQAVSSIDGLTRSASSVSVLPPIRTQADTARGPLQTSDDDLGPMILVEPASPLGERTSESTSEYAAHATLPSQPNPIPPTITAPVAAPVPDSAPVVFRFPGSLGVSKRPSKSTLPLVAGGSAAHLLSDDKSINWHRPFSRTPSTSVLGHRPIARMSSKHSVADYSVENVKVRTFITRI